MDAIDAIKAEAMVQKNREANDLAQKLVDLANSHTEDTYGGLITSLLAMAMSSAGLMVTLATSSPNPNNALALTREAFHRNIDVLIDQMAELAEKVDDEAAEGEADGR